MLNITKGPIPRAQRVVVYGAEGIGKTTLASKFPEPLFIDTEDGSTQLDVARLDKPDSFTTLVDMITEVSATPDICKTLVIDTADWAEMMAVDEVCRKYKKEGIEAFGYGKGYTYVAEEFKRFLDACDRVIDSGVNIVITAHAKMRKFEQPDEMGAYDRWEMKLSKNTAPLLKEWCDMLLFCNYKTFIVSGENGSKKAQGGKRYIYTTHSPVWDAKNRHGLPDEFEMGYEPLADIFKTVPTKKAPKPVAGDDGEIDFFEFNLMVGTVRSLGINTDLPPTELRQVLSDYYKAHKDDIHEDQKQAITYVGKWATKQIINNSTKETN